MTDEPAVDAFSPRLFARGMAVLRDQGYRTVDLGDLAKSMRMGTPVPVPDRSFVLTFDDGYQSIHEHLGPLLESFGWIATVFLTVGESLSGGPDTRLPRLFGRSMLSWAEIADLRHAGVTFGAHSLTHPDLTYLSTSRVEIEMERSKTMIEERLDTRVTSFAYPFGRYDRATLVIARRHFDCACSDRLGLVHRDSELYALERLDAHYLRAERLFESIASKWFPLYVRARAAPRRLRRRLSGIRTSR